MMAGGTEKVESAEKADVNRIRIARRGHCMICTIYLRKFLPGTFKGDLY
jgi:hypothetical protein